MDKPLSKKTSLLKSTEGSVAILFALASLMVMGITGTAVDFARATSVKSRLQAAADAAAIAGASLPATANLNRQQQAMRIFKGNVAGTALASVQPTILASNSQVSITAKHQHTHTIMQIFGFGEVELQSSSTARSQIQNGGVTCMLALNPTTSDGLHLQGINKVSSPDCWVWVNSTNSQAINAVGASQGTAQGFCSAGGVLGAEHFAPYPYIGCEPMDDPFYDKFASYNPPNVHTCNHTNLELKSGTHTLNPGVYCGNTVLKPQANVTFTPGLYVMKDGYFQVQAGASATGDGVTFFFYGQNTRLELRGGASMNVKAPTTGFFAGFVMVDRKFDWYDASIRETTIQGGGTLNIVGAVYAPQWKVNISGNGELNQSSPFFALVADSFYLEGNGKLYVNSDAAAAGMPNVMPKIKNGPVVMN